MAAIDPKLTRPIITGAPATTQGQNLQGQKTGFKQGASPFVQVLRQQLEAASNTAFSKHALNRVLERQIDVSQPNLERLNQGVRLAQEKGLKDALILIDEDAYIVNAALGKVVTVDGQAAKGSVFTHIDGTVIV